jgi:hypothetical protein
MKPATISLSLLSVLVLALSSFMTSCETVGGLEPRGAIGFAAGGFELSDEPEKQMPDPAIMVHKRTSGAFGYRMRTRPSSD